MLFRDREQAGRALADALKWLAGGEVIVLAIPRGGVVVGSVVAKALGAPLDVVITRKIGAPGEPEYALGAVTQSGEVILDEAAVQMLHVGKDYLDREAAGIPATQFALKDVLRSDEQDLREPLARCLDRPLDLRPGRGVCTHGVNGDASHETQINPWIAAAGKSVAGG